MIRIVVYSGTPLKSNSDRDSEVSVVLEGIHKLVMPGEIHKPVMPGEMYKLVMLGVFIS